MALVFEQQARESDKAFTAFSLYLGLGPQRSLRVVAQKLAKSEQLIKRWSKKFDWLARVQAYGAHLVVAEREAAEALARANGVDWAKRRQEQKEAEWQVRCELLESAREALRRWKEPGPKGQLRCGSLEGIARLLELASKLGRLASGMPTEKAEVTAQVDGVVRVEIEAALNKIYGEPLPGEVIEVESEECKVQSGGQGLLTEVQSEECKVQSEAGLLTSSPTKEEGGKE